jgi:hypothetical protein
VERAQRSEHRTTLTPTSGDPPSTTSKAPAAHPRSTGPLLHPQKVVEKRVQPPNPPLQPETHTPEGGSQLSSPRSPTVMPQDPL